MKERKWVSNANLNKKTFNLKYFALIKLCKYYLELVVKYH